MKHSTIIYEERECLTTGCPNKALRPKGLQYRCYPCKRIIGIQLARLKRKLHEGALIK